ncbi:MAG: hypothetical protein U5J83_17465 [Bryobacterales bacterium]|nr:hypothetical protein [Bryobacterales bacterium]
MRLPLGSLRWLLAACLLLGVLGMVENAPAQSFIDEIRIEVVEPSGGKVRPLEEAVLKVEIYGTLRSKDGSEQKGLLPLDAAYMAFAEKNSGWVSKAYQCPDFSQRDYLRERTGGWRDILGTVQNFTLKSCYVYTAPSQPGRYRLQASKDGVAGEITIEVDAGAPSTRQPEDMHFLNAAPSSDPYLPLVEHYAPFIAQETWFNPAADAITRFDFDGDFRGDNNWDNLGKGSTQAYVYYAVMETGTHWFLHYNFFHPRDYSDFCAVSTCHENDNEGMILAVRKDGSRFGKAEVMETLAHNLLFNYVADKRIEERAQNLNGEIAFRDGSHPMLFIEAGGHGVAGATDGKLSLYDHVAMRWLPGASGITYVYKGKAERPGHTGAENVGYALLPIYEHWWMRAIDRSRTERMFADYYTYAPLGDRPLTPLGTIPGAFLGTAKAANKARPFWGWHDDRTLQNGILARGQWALDPAYSFTRNLRFPDELPVSLDYTFNPYLGIGKVEGGRMAESNPVSGPAPMAEGEQEASVPPRPETSSPSLDGWGQPAGDAKPQAPTGWGDPPPSQQPAGAPSGWGTPEEKPKPKYPDGWGPPPA